MQTVQRQSPLAGGHGSRVSVWINPFCSGSAATPPQIAEPKVTPGPTELVSGFYLDGGPLRRFSTQGCRRPEPMSGGGTVQVLNPATGAVLATGQAGVGHLVEIHLAAGAYTAVGTFENAVVNGAHATRTITVQIPAGRTVRQDFTLNVP